MYIIDADSLVKNLHNVVNDLEVLHRITDDREDCRFLRAKIEVCQIFIELINNARTSRTL